MGDNIVNFYAGQPPLNRLSFQRQSADKLNAHLDAPGARFLVFKDLKPLVKKDEQGKLLFLSRNDVQSRIDKPYSSPSPAHAERKERARLYESARLPHTLPALVFLGIDDRPSASSESQPAAEDPRSPEGVPYFALDAGAAAAEWDVDGHGGEWADARASASAMRGWEANVFAEGRALVDWNTRNKFCAACGSPTYSLWGGWKRSCTSGLEPVEGKEPCFSLKGLHNFAYPRTDSVVIMGILNSAGDKILLGRQKSWPKGMYSCLAGFVEPGESFEDAVRREVMEEAGIEVGPVRYSSSQPWPYPANLMIGCYGRAADNQAVRLDLDNELEDAQWFSRDKLAELVGSPSGSHLSKEELKQLAEQAGQSQSEKAAVQAHQSASDKETAGALAPSEKRDGEGEGEGERKGLTRVPPATAIAGSLIRLWVAGGVELVSRL